jgi:hypothetical protein
MELLNIRSFLFVFISLFLGLPEVSGAQPRKFIFDNKEIFEADYNQLFLLNFENTSDFHLKTGIIKKPTDGGIKEDIPKKYSVKYQKWKAQLLSTDFGRQQWESYANNKNFILTITVSNEKEYGAKTDDYLWDEEGNFVGATITLGSKSDRGFPEPVYYPVMNSLSLHNSAFGIEGDVVAATKIAHEIGHVNQTFEINKDTFQLQYKLMPVYISIFLKNGYNSRDKNLIDLAEQMGGTPMKIWENREYWSEVNAMLFLKEKISKEFFYCDVFSKIKSNIETYAKNYEERFDQVQVSVCDK